jgi:hypothetical protein
VTERQFAELLSATTSLEQLTYIPMPQNLLTPRWDPIHGDTTLVAPGKVTAILNNHCPHLHKTLRQLTLEHFPLNDGAYRGVYSPLPNLTALRAACLGVSGLFLTPADHISVATAEGIVPTAPKPLAHLLPPHITALDIVTAGYWKERTAAALAQLLCDMQADKACLSSLKAIRVWDKLLFVPDAPRQNHAHPFFPYWWSLGEEEVERERGWDLGVVGELAEAVGLEVAVNPDKVPLVIRQLGEFSPVEARGQSF